jgi:hypothetical protein
MGEQGRSWVDQVWHWDGLAARLGAVLAGERVTAALPGLGQVL